MKRGIITILLVAVLAFAAFGSARAAEGKMTLDQFKKTVGNRGEDPRRRHPVPFDCSC